MSIEYQRVLAHLPTVAWLAAVPAHIIRRGSSKRHPVLLNLPQPVRAQPDSEVRHVETTRSAIIHAHHIAKTTQITHAVLWH